MKRSLLVISILAAFFCASNSRASFLNATKIGGLWTTTPISTSMSQALTGFRGAFTPMNIGMAVGTYVIISTIGDGINSLRVQMASPLPAAQSPPGWSDSATPPATSNTAPCYSLGFGCYSDGPSLCVAAYGASTTYQAPATCLDSSGNVKTNQIAITPTCPTGYTLSGSTCNLTNSAVVQWPSDGKPTVQPVNGVMTPNSRDPDNANYGASDLTRTGLDEYGNPVSESVSSNVSNGIDYERNTQSTNSTTGEPTVQRDRFSTDSQGNVTSSTSNIYNNSTVSNVNTSQSTTTPSVDVSALAKDATLQNTNAKLDFANTALADLDNKMVKDTTSIPSGVDPSVRTFHDSTALVFTTLKTYFPSLSFSDFIGQCPTFTQHIPFINVDLTIDQFCTMESYIRPTIHNVMLFLWPLVGLIIVLRA